MNLQKVKDRVNKKLRQSAKLAPYCFSCGIGNPDGNTLCLSHSNEIRHGKGRGLKAVDSEGSAILCAQCHGAVEGHYYKLSREERLEMQRKASVKTMEWWKSKGYL